MPTQIDTTTPIVVDLHYMLASKKLRKYIYYFRVKFHDKQTSMEGPFDYIPPEELHGKRKKEELALGIAALGMIQTRIKATHSDAVNPIYIYSDLFQLAKALTKDNFIGELPKCIQKFGAYVAKEGLPMDIRLMADGGLDSALRKTGREILRGWFIANSQMTQGGNKNVPTSEDSVPKTNDDNNRNDEGDDK